MSEQSNINTEDNHAFIKYDKALGNILEVALHNQIDVEESASILEVLMPVSMSFLTGEKRLSDFKVAQNDEGVLSLLPKIHKRIKRNFWDMCSVDAENSPLNLLEQNSKHFTVELKPDAKTDDVIMLYITELDEPNCLYQIIKLSKSDISDNKSWTVSVNFEDDYSIYVRNHAA